MRMHRIALPVIATLLLTTCTSVPHTQSPAAGTSPTAELIRARAFYPERMPLPPGTTLEVQLIDNHAADAVPISSTPAATVAHVVFNLEHGPPFDFTLVPAGASEQSQAGCSLRASVRDAQGHLEAVTGARVPVTPGKPVELHLIGVQSASTSASTSPPYRPLE